MRAGVIIEIVKIAVLSIELPVTTTIMLRPVAAIARSEGDNMNLV
jgi:hypothetical protein